MYFDEYGCSRYHVITSTDENDGSWYHVCIYIIKMRMMGRGAGNLRDLDIESEEEYEEEEETPNKR